MAAFMVVMPLFLLALCVFGYIGEKIPERFYNALWRKLDGR